jgi:hypothetical protein
VTIEEMLEQMRGICMGFPEVTERLSHGQPTWFVQDKRSFAMFLENHHDSPTCIWCAARGGAQEGLIASDPARFFRPPYVGPRGWVGIWLDSQIDWDEVEGLLIDAYRMIAPPKLLKLMDSSQ